MDKPASAFNETTPQAAMRMRRVWSVLAAFFVVVAMGPAAWAQTSLATLNLTQGWATFGQALPQGAASGGLQVGTLTTQTDVKNRWPDGSIRFAVVTVNVPSSGPYALLPATLPAGTFTPSIPSASATFVIGGVTYTATLPSVPSTDTWLSGPLAYEGRSVVAPVASGSGAHPFLRVIFDTRVYSDGTARVDFTVENVLDLVGATSVTYDVTLNVAGQVAFSKLAVQHFYLTRWRKAFTVGVTPFSTITPDIAPFNTAAALPPFLPSITNRLDAIIDPTRYDILASGALDTDMSAHGGRGALAPYPDWTARYLVHKDPAQRTFVLLNGDLAGSWPIHVREAETSTNTGVGGGRFISLNQRPNIWYDQRAQGAGWDFVHGLPLPIREYTPLCPPPPASPPAGCQNPQPGQTRLIPDNAHQPSLAFVPYLLTGDRYYADEMMFWADYAMLRTYLGDGVRGALGVLANNEVRGFGWALRNIADAAAYHPDTAVRTYLTEKVNANLQWLDNYANGQDPIANPLKLLWPGYRPEVGFISLWEQTYLAWAIDRAKHLGFTGGLAQRDAIASLQLKLFTSDPDFPRETVVATATTLPDGTVVPAGTRLTWGMPYLVGYGSNPSAGVFTFNKTMAEVWAQTNNLTLQRNYAGFYGPEARLNLMTAIEKGWTGAQAAYDYLWPFIGINNFWGTAAAPVPDLAERAGWAVDFYPSTTTPPPPPPPPPPPTATPVPAALVSPATAQPFTSSVMSFVWTAGTAVTSYKLDVGSTQGGTNFYTGAETLAQSAVVNGLPVNGSTVWVRLSSKINGIFQIKDYSFTSYTAPPPPAAAVPLTAKVVATVNGNSTVQTPLFSTQAGDLLVAFVSSSGPNGLAETMRVLGGNLTWTLQARANAQNGVSEIWSATTPTALANITVTSMHTLSTTDQSLVVVAFSGAAGIGAKAFASAPSGAPSLSLTSTKAGSFVYGVGNDWNGAVPRTLAANQVMVQEVLGINGDTFWVQRVTSPTPGIGAIVTIADTAPIDHTWNLAAVEITPSDSSAKAIPVITWPAPADIVKGTPLGAAQLNATASVPGAFAYSPAPGTVLNAGSGQTLSATFYPTDTAAYQTATAQVLINVLASGPTVTWSAPAPINVGTPLSAAQLNATADAAGTFVYTPALGVVLPIGLQTLSVTFTPANTAFAPITTTVPLSVIKRKPVITWPTPANITPGTALSAAQLNATADVPGVFVYSPVIGTVLPTAPGQKLTVTFTPTDLVNVEPATASVAITVAAAGGGAGTTPTPIRIGTTIAGTWKDATGHSGQSHLVFSPNTNRWWLFTLASTHDTIGDRTVQAYVSSGPDLATATWSASTTSPTLGNAGGATNSLLAGGRSLGVALRTIGATDYVHVFVSAAFDGQVSSNGHARAQLGAGTIAWGAWNNPGSPNAASEWNGPSGTGGSSLGTNTAWGNSVGISTGGFIHHFSVTMDQEVDCAVGRSTSADIGATWTNGFGNNISPTGVSGTSPPWTTAVIDKNMANQCKVLAFAPLATDVMLAVYSNGNAPQPQLTNLRYQRSGTGSGGTTAGQWTNISAAIGGGNGDVFATTATIDQNDWALVPVNTGLIYAFRRNQLGTAIEGRQYSVSTNGWTNLTVALPAFAAGQAFKSGGGLFGATDGTSSVWLFFINTDASNSILFTKFNGSTWTPWAAVPGTNSGTHSRAFITGNRLVGSSQIGLAWTEGTTSFDVFTTSLNTGTGSTGTSPVTVTLTAPLANSSVTGITTVSATATSTAGTIAGVQFLLDGVALGPEDTISPYSISWDTSTAAAGTHYLSAIARDSTGASGFSNTPTVSVDAAAPTVSVTTPANGQTVRGVIVASADASDDIGIAGVQFLLDGAALGPEVTAPPYAINWDTSTATSGSHVLTARARDAAGRQTTSAGIIVTTTGSKLAPTIAWSNPVPIAYGTPLGAAQLNATANVPGAFVYSPAAGTVLPIGTLQPLSV
ncbi:MAG: hypothetical protein HOQ29_11305, partial [Acidobacteria bacterium]|nr:hypothetical protein [Acidobacteriota bacterium]